MISVQGPVQLTADFRRYEYQLVTGGTLVEDRAFRALLHLPVSFFTADKNMESCAGFGYVSSRPGQAVIALAHPGYKAVIDGVPGNLDILTVTTTSYTHFGLTQLSGSRNEGSELHAVTL